MIIFGDDQNYYSGHCDMFPLKIFFSLNLHFSYIYAVYSDSSYVFALRAPLAFVHLYRNYFDK